MVEFPDKIKLTKTDGFSFVQNNFTVLVQNNARFEGIETSLEQTQTIIDGMAVSGVSLDDINVIVDLKKAWEFVTQTDESVSLEVAQKINKIVAAHDALIPGELRTGEGAVSLGSGEQFSPSLVDENGEKTFFAELLDSDKTSTDKALTLMFHLMRNQIFWDGNKRTATLIANKLLIDNGAGLINVPLNLWEEFNNYISDFYRTGDMTQIKNWAYEVAIQVQRI